MHGSGVAIVSIERTPIDAREHAEGALACTSGHVCVPDTSNRTYVTR
jgi:hypothetical protein